VAIFAGAAEAQDFTAGKTPAQLFASDCSVCHKSPQGLSRSDARSLANFLREHYTTKPETAGSLAAFVAAANAGGPPPDGKPKPAAGRERPQPPAGVPTDVRARRPEGAAEGEQAVRPAPKPRSVSVDPKPTEHPKPAEHANPAERRPAAQPRVPGEAARPGAHPAAAPAANPEGKPPVRARGGKPEISVKRDGEKPAAGSDAKLEAYTSSGEAAKPIEAEAAAASAESDRRLHTYATSGGGIGSLMGDAAKPAQPEASPQPAAAPAEPEQGEGAKPAAAPEPNATTAPDAKDAGGRKRPRRAAAPVEGEAPADHQ
jgi:hypothetical protein